MPILGIPIPDAITETFLPLYSPVYPSIPRIPFTCLTFFKKVSAITFALNGSPGITQLFAKSPFFASICGVGTLLIIYLPNQKFPK